MGFRLWWEKRFDLDGFILRKLAGWPVPMSAVAITHVFNCGSSARVYPALMRLERAGKVQSMWEDGPCPRRRLYFVPTDSPQKK